MILTWSQALRAAAREAQGVQLKLPRKSWISQGAWSLMKRRAQSTRDRALLEKQLANAVFEGSEVNGLEAERLRRQLSVETSLNRDVKKALRRNRNAHWHRVGHEAEETLDRGDLRKAFQLFRQIALARSRAAPSRLRTLDGPVRSATGVPKEVADHLCKERQMTIVAQPGDSVGTKGEEARPFPPHSWG